MNQGASETPPRKYRCDNTSAHHGSRRPFNWSTLGEQPPVGCLACGSVYFEWVNAGEVAAHLMKHDPEYRGSYTQGGVS